MIIDYFKTSEYILEKVWFDYRGCRYSGRGVLTWNPEAGLEAYYDLFKEKNC
ncbi:hypothetical protein [Zarconia navalis]|uniref:hypothetical protein n=1 Tax=Zarconia navalis TaxID=2992134 RepID=UPI0021F83E7F|nr:hypothetical protein [Zarconia navalis]